MKHSGICFSHVFGNTYGDLYHYAGNNPVRYTDPDGRILRVAPDPNNLKTDYDAAISYLLSSAAGNNITKRVILSLERDLNFSVMIISGQNGSYYYDDGKCLTWDRENIPYNEFTGVYNSASIGLFHELCHVWIDNTNEGKKFFKRFVREYVDELDMMYDRYSYFFNEIHLSRKEFYIEQFVTELEKLVGLDLEGKNSRNCYFELNGEHEITVNSVFDCGEVER